MRVSVVINNFNYERYVVTAVESALCQTHPDVEVIVVDDGSRDRSVEVLQKYASSATIVAKANGGQGSAYNEGFRLCTGSIVLFLDADDWLYPDAVEHVVAAWRPGVVKVQFPLGMVDRAGVSLGRRIPRDMSDKVALQLLRRFGAYDSPPGSGNAFAADFLRRILPMPEAQWRIAADTVPILLAPAYGEIVSLSEPMGAYRLHKPDGEALLMNNAPLDLWDEYRRIERTKQFLLRHLAQLGVECRNPMLLAPWEARVVALCARFGERTVVHGDVRIRLFWFAFHSLWRWPKWSIKRKIQQAVWMCLVLLLPSGIARNVALRHKHAVGLPAGKPA